MTTQEVMSPADLKVQETIRRKIHWMKHLVKYDTEALRGLKLCRPTLKPHPDRGRLVRRYCAYGRIPYDIQFEIHRRKQDATARLLVYGQLRKKEHSVVEPERWADQVAQVLKDLETQVPA